jgi:four helix bundle protein
MSKIERFEDLELWQLARDICKDIFTVTHNESFSKDFSLKDQIRRSSGSIMDNIAEGFERDGNKEFITFLYYSKGSCGEVRSQLYRALDYHYISQNEFDTINLKANNISKSLSNFIKYLKNSDIKGLKYK